MQMRMSWGAVMLNKLRELWSDRRGNALIIAAGALPLIIGSAGLASDTIQWTLWKRQLQRAADSAAISGAYARIEGTSASDAVTTDLTKNNQLWVPLLSGYPQTTTPANTTTWSHQVQVVLAVQQKLGFSSVFISTPPMITATAKAAAVDDGAFCVVSLEHSSDPGITIQGSTTTNLGCGAISDSIAVTTSVNTNGAAYNFASSIVAAVGGLPATITGSANLQPYHLAQPDPYEGLDTSVPSGTSCTNFNSHIVSTSGSVTTISPGCYNSWDKNGNYAMQPGTYYLNNTDFDRTGNGTLTGTGVTIVLTGSNPGTVKTNGTSSINLSAPTTGAFAKILIAQSTAAGVDNNNTINGTNSSTYDGALYFPKGLINFTGTTGAISKCLMVVSKKVNFAGNSNIQNDVNGCTANTTVTGKKIRLVA
ncbi:MAG: pilus assembly protein TadG-related protein [Sphingomicrobium sp.]|nr:Tad domain-containing protein [Sphingomonadales bacterium]